MNLIQQKNKERKRFLIFSILIIFFSRAIYPILYKFFYKQLLYNEYALSIGFLILPISFSIFLGCMNFSDRMKFTLGDFSLNYKNTFFTIYISGILILLLVVSISLLSFLPFNIKYDFLFQKKYEFFFFYFLFLIFIYTFSTFSSVLFKRFALSFMFLSILFIFLLIIFIPLIIVFLLLLSSLNLFLLLCFLVFIGIFLYFSLIFWNGYINNFSVKKSFLRAILIFILFSYGTHGIANIITSLKLKSIMNDLREKGIKTELNEVIPQKVPEDKNSAFIYNEIFKIMKKTEEKYKKEIKYIPYQYVYQEKLKPEEKEIGKKIIKGDEFKKIFQLT